MIRRVANGSSRNAAAGAALGLPEGALLLVVLLWGSTFPLTKITFTEMHPAAFTFVRFALMLLLAFGVLLVRHRRAPERVPLRARASDLPRFILAGVTGYTLYQLFYVYGLERTSPFSSSLLIALVPLFTVVFVAFMGERTPTRGWIGLGIAVLGAVVFVSEKAGSLGTLLGDLLSLGAAVSFAIYSIANRPLVRDYPTETYTAYTLLAGSVPLLLACLPAALSQDWSRVSLSTWLIVVYLVALPVYIAYMLWNWAIARRGLALATGFSLLVPICSGVLSALLTGETFGAIKIVGSAIVLVGLVLPRLPIRSPTTVRS